MPRPVREASVWLRVRDRLNSSHWLTPSRLTQLDAELHACRTPAELHDFAAAFFSLHQIRAEILAFLDLARGESPRIVMEIGTAAGGTNFLLGAALPSVSLKLSVDLFVQNTRLLSHFARPDCEQVFLHGPSNDRATLLRVREILAGRPLDVLFIDGDHTYAGVQSDYELYAPLVRPGGLIAFHDIVPDYLTRYGRATNSYVGDVPRYWREVRGQFSETWEFVADREQDGYGIGVGRVRAQ